VSQNKPDPLSTISFQDFRRLAADPGLSQYEKIGFPDSYREGRETAIFSDMVVKLPPLSKKHATVVDIGPGCSDLPRLLISHAEDRSQHLHLVDSQEMLDHLPDAPGCVKHAAYFPECTELLQRLTGRADAVIAYSVLQYAFIDGIASRFLEAACQMLAPGGHLLLGDIPNASMRSRYFASEEGLRAHRAYLSALGREAAPPTPACQGSIDDDTILSILSTARRSGLHAFLLPQPAGLPMHNRREDILIVRP
jgi:hypothetical protein